MTLRVILPIFNSAIDDKYFTSYGANPGCGGTQFVTIMLALHLAQSRADYEIHLLHNKPISIVDQPDNLKQSIISSLHDAASSNLLTGSNTVLICPSAQLRSLLDTGGSLPDCKTIAWLHHPFDIDPRLARQQLAAYVSVGIYQYHSNNVLYRPHWHIPNLFSAPLSKPSNKPPFQAMDTLDLVYLGALIPAKGFHHIARQWPRIKQEHPAVKLHVIGSIQTYGNNRGHPVIPTTESYAQEILRYLPIKDIENGNVVFYGNMGTEKLDIIQASHVALLNPIGSTEAFPASPIECMALGTPVIASDDYGMSDVMRYFPRLSLKHPQQLTKKIKCLISDSNFYREMSYRSLAVAQWFSTQTPQILLRWQRLIDGVCLGNNNVACDPPQLSYGGGKLRIKYRQARKLCRSLIERKYSRLNRG